MTRDEAIAFIKFGLGNRTGTELDDAIIQRMKQAQRLLEQGRSLPWFLKEQSALNTLEAGEEEIDFPDGFLREYPNETFHYTSPTTDKIIYLEKVIRKEGDIFFSGMNDDSGRPRAYAIRKGNFLFFPIADRDYVLEWSYYKSAGTLDSDVSDNAWLVNAPDILIGRAGSLIAEVIAHDRAKAAFDQQFMIAWNAAFADGLLRDEENDPLYLGAKF